MYIVKPITIDDDKFLSSTVAEDDYDEWESTASYIEDAYVIVINDHRVYRCAVANTDKLPIDNIYDDETDPDNPTGYWVDVSATNKWKLFDGKSRAATTATDELEIKIQPRSVFNRLPLLNVGASLITVSIADTDGTNVYQETVSTADTTGIDDFYPWFFSPLVKKTDFIFEDLPAYSNATVTITLSDHGETVTLGECVLGTSKFIGHTRLGYSVGISDYSEKGTDEEDNATLEEGVYYDSGNFPLRLKPEQVSDVKNTLAAYRATALVFVGDSDRQETLIYGFYTDFSIILFACNTAYCEIEIEELS